MDIVSIPFQSLTKSLGEKELSLSISEAIKEHPELVRKYLGTVIPQKIILCRIEFSCFL
jgi:Fe-S cluster assembly protein SufB